jgi:hypothetical protein
VITISWLAAILVFGFFWNNSDDQFYFQMAPAFGALAARIPGRRGRAGVFVALSVAGLLWNLVDVSSHRIFYPRQERMALLEREVQGACLVVYPGFDEPEMLLRLSRPAKFVPQVSLTYLASRYPVDEGIKRLRSDIGTRGSSCDGWAMTIGRSNASSENASFCRVRPDRWVCLGYEP